MTWFGALYLVLTLIGFVSKISEIGKPRKPVTHQEVSLALICGLLITWGLFTVGVTNHG